MIGFICNFLVKAVNARFHMKADDAERAAAQIGAARKAAPGIRENQTWQTTNQNGTTTLQLVLAWGFVGIPLVLGVLQTLVNSMKLFK